MMFHIHCSRLFKHVLFFYDACFWDPRLTMHRSEMGVRFVRRGVTESHPRSFVKTSVDEDGVM